MTLLLPEPWEQKRPMDGEHARWTYRTSNGGTLTLALVPGPGVNVWSGPGSVYLECDDEDLELIIAGKQAAIEWYHRELGRPTPLDDQPSLFDEVAP